MKTQAKPTPTQPKQPLTVAQRLANRDRQFFDGPADLSDRQVRKEIVHEAIEAKSEER